MAGVKVAIIGVGNVGSTFARGVAYYSIGSRKVGLWHDRVAGLRPADIDIVAAFDVDSAKVGKPLQQLISENDGSNEAHHSGPVIEPGIIAGKDDPGIATPSTTTTEGFSSSLKRSKADIAINLISSGLDATSTLYSKLALKAGVSFANATPSKIARNSTLSKTYADQNLLLVGDDLLSQLGGTAFHKGMIDFMVERGVHVNRSYQLDVGGTEETKRTMDERIKMTKRSMKTKSIGMEAPYAFESVAGTTEYTDFLGDYRNSYYWMSSTGFMGSEVIMDLRLHTSDSANAGNVLLDVVRAASKKSKAKHANVISAYAFKSPPKDFGIREAYRNFASLFT